MEIIEAYWEERNLGLKSFEISLSKADKISDFISEEKKLIKEKKAEYIVVKAAVNVPDFLFELPKLNYTFIETAFRLILKKDAYHCPDFISKFDKDVEVKPVGAHDLERVFGEIFKGIFDTDRISIDRGFSQQEANNRYVNWISTLVEQGEKLYEVYLKKTPIGFFILKSVDKATAQGILTGLYEKYATSGYGTLIMKKLNDTVWSSGYNTYIAQVVSNNVKALRVNLLFGSVIESMTYNYIKRL